MAKRKKFPVRKENLIVFILLGIGLLFFLIGIDFSVDTSETDIRVTQAVISIALEAEGYEVLDVWGGENSRVTNGVEMNESKSDGRALQVFKGLTTLSMWMNFTEEPRFGYSIWIVEDSGVYSKDSEETLSTTCQYNTLLTNYNSYRKMLNDEKVFVDSEDLLDGLIFEEVVGNADTRYNQNQPNKNEFMDMYLESYPEVTEEVLGIIVWFQVMDSEKCILIK